jgi:hypothetical protein
MCHSGSTAPHGFHPRTSESFPWRTSICRIEFDKINANLRCYTQRFKSYNEQFTCSPTKDNRSNISVVAGDMKMGLAGKVVAAKAVKGRRDDKKDAKEEKKEEKK